VLMEIPKVMKERKKRLKTYEVLLAYYATSVVISP